MEFSIVKLVAVLKEKLVSGTEARFDTVLDHDARPRWTRQLLHLKKTIVGKHCFAKIEREKIAFMRKKVMEVRRSTVDLRSISFSLLEAGKLLRYIDRSMRNELCNWSSSFTNFSLPKFEAAKRSLAETALDAVVCA